MKKIEPERTRSHRTSVSLILPSRKPMRILIAAIPPVRPLDVVGPVEVFGDANRIRGGEPVYSVEIVVSGEEKLMDTHFKMPMLADRTYREVAGSFDTVLVAGGDGANKMQYQPPFVDWLKRQCGSARRFGSICTGALVLAQAGLLEGRRATTHWNWCGELAQNYPGVRVDPDPIYVKDGNCYTSAGVTAGIDMTLAMVEEDLGSELALRIARMMVVFLRRPGGQSQFSATLAAQSQDHRSWGDLLAWIADNIRRDLSIDMLARRAAMSPRNFARLFTQEIGKTPGTHVEDLRLEAARRQLESTPASLEEVAKYSGFKSAEVLRRLFARRLGTTPGQYRKSFGCGRHKKPKS
jgi:transcriptional regulator GlxA family with amidase domain